MLLHRIKCHACGTRSPHSTSSGVRQFQCKTCQAWTFLDAAGVYVDPPLQHIQQQSYSQATRTLIGSRPQRPVFCSTCIQNQQIYHETLANYLPDEDHPKYKAYERELPAYKRSLEARYPQICKACAPKAQSMIHEADYNSMTYNAERLIGSSRSARRSASPMPAARRDSGDKIFMRTLLDLVGWIQFLGVLYQAIWHLYRILGMNLRSQTSVYNELDVRPRASECIEEISRSVFSQSCAREIAQQIPKILIISTCCLWYNPALKRLYDPSTRYVTVTGKLQHFAISTTVLALRAVIFYLVSSAIFPQDQELAVHGFALSVLVIGSIVARSSVHPEKWVVAGSIMPRPEEEDVLGQNAGPAREGQVAHASPSGPDSLLRSQNIQRFPLENLAPTRRRTTVPPSPSLSDHGDPMDIETEPLVPQQNEAGWSALRNNLFSMDDELRAQQHSQSLFQPKAQASPFRGQLPAAPISQERRLRNPVSQVPRFKEMPVTQRQDFLNQMRDGIDRGRGFGHRRMSVETDASDATTDARTRTRGQLELDHSSGWNLPEDVNKATGLEDLFGGSFQLGDPTDQPVSPGTQGAMTNINQGVAVVGVLLAVTLGAVFLDIASIRRPVCLMLVRALEALEY